MQVINIKFLKAEIKRLKNKAQDPKNMQPTVEVGYTQSYAIFVHEVPAKHAEGKQWKYLETPARQLTSVLAKIIKDVTLKTGSLRQGLLLAGLRLQRASQEIVPIDTAALKASAYTAFAEDAPAAAAAARAKSDQLRASVIEKRAKGK
jgi:hypothetical protein